MPVNHDEVINALCVKAAKVDNVSKKLETKNRVERPSSPSVSSASNPDRNLQMLFNTLCAKAKDVAIASKISEATDHFGKLSPSPATKAPAKVVASICVQASAFQLHDDDDATATHYECAPGSLSKKRDNDIDQESSTTSSSSESEISDRFGYPRRASISSCSPIRINTSSASKMIINSPSKTLTISPTHLLASLDASSSTFYLFDDDETATQHGEITTVNSLTNQYHHGSATDAIFGLQTSNLYGSPRRIASTNSPANVAASLGIPCSTFHLFDDDETATNHDETTVGSFSRHNVANQQSSTFGSITDDTADASMTSEELYELSKRLVTTPSGGNDTFAGSRQQHRPPPRVMLSPKPNCDTSITSDLTDWDFGLSKSGTASLSELDADKVVENFYKMAATDPVLARRIALAATSVINAEETSKAANVAGMGKVYPRGFSALATVRECEDAVEQTVKPMTTPSSPKPTRMRRMSHHLQPRAKPGNPSITSSAISDSIKSSTTFGKQRKTATKIHQRPKMESRVKAGGLEVGSLRPRNDRVDSPKSRKDPPGHVRLDMNPGVCFIQDNPKSHR